MVLQEVTVIVPLSQAHRRHVGRTRFDLLTMLLVGCKTTIAATCREAEVHVLCHQYEARCAFNATIQQQPNVRYNKGLDRFTLRGRIRVDVQWKLFCLVRNIEKLTNNWYAA